MKLSILKLTIDLGKIKYKIKKEKVRQKQTCSNIS